MTVEPAQEWGTPAVVPREAVRVGSDHAAATSTRGSSVILEKGDLHRGLGCPAPRAPGEVCTRLPVDAMTVTINSATTSAVVAAVAHVRVGRWRSRRDMHVLVNAGFVDGLNLAPRGHPGDGVVELVTMSGSMRSRQRGAALRRARTGTHVPHPDISIVKVGTWRHERRGRTPLFIDGRRIRKWASVSVEVNPGALDVLV